MIIIIDYGDVDPISFAVGSWSWALLRLLRLPPSSHVAIAFITVVIAITAVDMVAGIVVIVVTVVIVVIVVVVNDIDGGFVAAYFKVVLGDGAGRTAA